MKRLIGYRIAGLALAIVFSSMAVGTGQAQQTVSVNAGTVSCVEGEAFYDGNPVRLPKGTHLQMENGHSLGTNQGRAEMLLSSYSHLRLGANSRLRMLENDISDTRLALEQGSALIEVVQEIKGNRVSVVVSKGVVEIEKAGLYRVDSASGELRVYGGEALAVMGNRRVSIRSSRMARFAGSLTSEKFDTDEADSLHKWAAQRSFSLFAAAPESRKQTHWTPVSLGWVHNSNFRMSFFSEYFRQLWIKDQATRKLEELMAKYRMEQDQGQRTIYGAEYEELLAHVKEALRAMQEAEEEAKHADSGALQPKPDAGRVKEKSPVIPERYVAIPTGS